jgi:hypothetical protein
MSVDCPLILSLSKDAVLTVTLFDLRVDSGFRRNDETEAIVS